MIHDRIASGARGGFTGKVFRVADLWVDPTAGRIAGPGGTARVDPKVMAVLVALARRPRDVLPDQPTPAGYAFKPANSTWRRAGLLAALLALTVAWWLHDRAGDERAPQAHATGPLSIAVLPFVDLSAEVDQAYFADGITEELINVLARLPDLRVIALAVAENLELAFRRDDPGPDAHTPDPEAYALNLHGWFLFNRRLPGDLDHAEGYYRRALEIDPEYAAAWAGLSGVYFIQAVDGERDFGQGLALAREAAERAVELDPALALIHAIDGQAEQFDAAVARLSAKADLDSAIALAHVFAFTGDADVAFDWLDVARGRIEAEEIDDPRTTSRLTAQLRTSLFLEPLRTDSRWQDWLLDPSRQLRHTSKG